MALRHHQCCHGLHKIIWRFVHGMTQLVRCRPLDGQPAVLHGNCRGECRSFAAGHPSGSAGSGSAGRLERTSSRLSHHLWVPSAFVTADSLMPPRSSVGRVIGAVAVRGAGARSEVMATPAGRGDAAVYTVPPEDTVTNPPPRFVAKTPTAICLKPVAPISPGRQWRSTIA